MAGTIQEKAEAIPGAVARRIGGLIREMLPPVTFFLIALTLMYVSIQLLALQYQIHFFRFARAVIGALILGKVTLVMDWAWRKRKVSGYPGAVRVAIKTVVYALAVIVLAFGERIVDAWRASGSLSEGIAIVSAHANFDRFMGLLVMGSTILALYLALEEISQAMGEGELTRLFFKRPEGSTRHR
jgi:hypothetical protein